VAVGSHADSEADSPEAPEWPYAGEGEGGEFTFAEHLEPTWPAARTEPAAEVTVEGAGLRGTANPEGSATSYRFEYDTAAYKSGEGSHGTSVPVSGESIGAGTSDVEASQTVKGLEPLTTYHYRLVASNEIGTTYGAEKTFTTQAVTTLCAKEEAACAEADRYPSKTSFTATAESPGVTIANTVSDVTCTESTLAGETSSEAGTPLPLKISTWSLAGCSNKSGKSCTSTTTLALPESASLSWSEGSNGALAIGSGLQWKIVCSGISCTMTFQPTGTLKGGSTGQITIPETKLKKISGLFCPVTMTFKAASYSVSAPKPVYVKRRAY
jgi:hypothetical protein